MDTVQKYIQSERKTFMSVSESVTLSHEIASRIVSTDFEPDLVVGVANGALLMTKIISDDLQLPMQMVKIRRKGSSIKSYVAKFRSVNKILSLWYKIPVLRWPLVCAMRQFEPLEKSDKLENECVTDFKRIVLVDDVIDTGHTINLIASMMNKGGAEAILIAVISWKTEATIPDSIKPEIYITHKIHHYPWSSNSHYFGAYEQWLVDNNIMSSK